MWLSAPNAVYKACGKRPTAFRCPGGNMSSVMQNTAKKEGMIIAYWSVDTEDWKSRNPAQIYQSRQSTVPMTAALS